MITVSRTALALELALMAAVVKGERVIPILTCAHLVVVDNRLRLCGSSIDATLNATIDAEGDLPATCVPFAPLYAAVKLFDGEAVTMALRDDGRLQVSCGRSRHRLPTYDASQFPPPDPVDGDTLLLNAPTLLSAITAVAPCMDSADGRWATRGVNVEGAEGELNVIAFNGTQMGVVRLRASGATFSATIIDSAIPALSKVLATGDDVAMTVGSNNLKFELYERVLLTRQLVGKFPAWRTIAPADPTHTVTLTPDVAVAIKRCSVTASEGNLVKRRLKLEFGHDVLTVRSYGGDGESVEECEIGCPTLNGESVVVKVNADQLLAYLQSANSPTCAFSHAESILTFTEGARRYLHATLRKDG